MYQSETPPGPTRQTVRTVFDPTSLRSSAGLAAGAAA